jgi:hypothetical protein
VEKLVIQDGITEIDFDRVRDMLAEFFWAPGIRGSHDNAKTR